jgi:acyl carrier protein
MTKEEIWRRLTAVFRDIFGDDDILIRPETTAEDIEEWDSLTNVQLLVAIERVFGGVKFSTGEVANLQNVGQMVAIIEKKV